MYLPLTFTYYSYKYISKTLLFKQIVAYFLKQYKNTNFFANIQEFSSFSTEAANDTSQTKLTKTRKVNA